MEFNNKQFWNEFKNEKFVIHCDTEEKANEFLKHCEENGIGWIWENATDKNYYDRNFDKTCYRYDKDDLTLSVSNICYYRNGKYNIIEL